MRKADMMQYMKSLIFRKRNNEGVVSVYLCMMLAVMISVLLIIIEASRVNAMQTQIECSSDMAMDSALSEYNQILLDRYGLLFIDTSYGKSEGSLDNLTEHIKSYLEYNLNPQKDELLLLGSSDLLGLSVDSIDVLNVSRATDDNGKVFRYMAESYMLEKYGFGYIDDIQSMINTTNEYSLFDTDLDEEYEQAQDDFYNFESPGEESAADFDDLNIENPTTEVNNLRGINLMEVCGIDVSDKRTNLDYYVTHRDLVAGNGLPDSWEERNSIEEELLFNEYILQKFGNFRSRKDNSVLDYEIEYIIAGKGSDEENLTCVALNMINIRGASNTIYYFTNAELQSEVELIAYGLSTALAMPELEYVFEAMIAAAWIYSESVYDVKVLLDGGKIPLIKAPGQWNLGITSILSDAIDVISGSAAYGHNEGLSYEDYLRLILYISPIENRTLRSMDIIEMDVRNITGSSSFKMDNCIASAGIQMIFTSTHGYSCLLQRVMEYW